jgi:protease-4
MRRWIWLPILAMVLFIGGIIAVLTVLGLFGEQDRFSMEDGIGLVEVKGLIIDPQETVKQLYDFKKNERIKAIVLRVDSPGGVVGPSQEIYEAVKKVNVTKKVVVSMGSVAASGGYYISAPATLIYANPGTITGSIGVLMKLSNIEGLMGKIGMKSFTLKTGQFKDSGSPFRTMTLAERQILQGVIDSTHRQFVAAVAAGRKLPVETVASIADGRILSGEQAKEYKLVDRLGTLRDAIEEAGRLGGIAGEPPVIHPPKKKGKMIDMLVEESSTKLDQLAHKGQGYSMRYEAEWQP